MTFVNSPLGRTVKLDAYGNPIYDVYIRKVVRRADGKYWSVPTEVYPNVSQFWTYDPATYEGAGHGFMRAGETPLAADADQKAQTAYAANKRARDSAWQRWVELLKKI